MARSSAIPSYKRYSGVHHHHHPMATSSLQSEPESPLRSGSATTYAFLLSFTLSTPITLPLLHFQREQPGPPPHPGHLSQRPGWRAGPRTSHHRQRDAAAGALSAADRAPRLGLDTQRRGVRAGRGGGGR